MKLKNFTLKTFLVIALVMLSNACNSDQKQHQVDLSKEFRAVWLHSGLFDKNPDVGRQQICSLFDSYRDIGINNLFCYYTLPEENGFTWDYLQVLIEEGRKRGIKIHSNICPGHNVVITGKIEEHPEWLIQDREGNRLPNLNLTLADVREYWLRQINRLLAYDIDGIHLDYIRFPVNQSFSYDSLTIAAFKEEYGLSPLDDSQDDGSMIWCEWIGWNARQITGFIVEIREFIRASDPKVVLGADVFPNPETAKVLIGQDWESWADMDILDFICLMSYTNDLDLFREYSAHAVRIAGNGNPVYPGIGVGTSHNKITKDLLVQEVQIAREEKTDGVVFFSGNSFSQEMRDTLKSTVFSR